MIAVTAGFKNTTHPNNPATYPTTNVTRPINARATMNANHPPNHLVGGIRLNKNFQKIDKKCKKASNAVISSTFPSSSTCGYSIHAYLN